MEEWEIDELFQSWDGPSKLTETKFNALLDFEYTDEYRHPTPKTEEELEFIATNGYGDPFVHNCRVLRGKKCMMEGADKREYEDDENDREHDKCINQSLFIECAQGCGDACQNQAFRKDTFKTRFSLESKGGRGFGLVCHEAISAGDPVLKYVGDVYYEHENPFRNKSPYTCLFKSSSDFRNVVVEPLERGNICRFSAHSHRPNCLMRTFATEKTLVCVLIALVRISPGTELTWHYEKDYKFENCLCLEDKVCDNFFKVMDRYASNPPLMAINNPRNLKFTDPPVVWMPVLPRTVCSSATSAAGWISVGYKSVGGRRMITTAANNSKPNSRKRPRLGSDDDGSEDTSWAPSKSVTINQVQGQFLRRVTRSATALANISAPTTSSLPTSKDISPVQASTPTPEPSDSSNDNEYEEQQQTQSELESISADESSIGGSITGTVRTPQSMEDDAELFPPRLRRGNTRKLSSDSSSNESSHSPDKEPRSPSKGPNGSQSSDDSSTPSSPDSGSEMHTDPRDILPLQEEVNVMEPGFQTESDEPSGNNLDGHEPETMPPVLVREDLQPPGWILALKLQDSFNPETSSQAELPAQPKLQLPQVGSRIPLEQQLPSSPSTPDEQPLPSSPSTPDVPPIPSSLSHHLQQQRTNLASNPPSPSTPNPASESLTETRHSTQPPYAEAGCSTSLRSQSRRTRRTTAKEPCAPSEPTSTQTVDRGAPTEKRGRGRPRKEKPPPDPRPRQGKRGPPGVPPSERTCPECGHLSTDAKNHRTHVQEVHGPRNVPCTYPGCDWKFTSERLLEQHLPTHLDRADRPVWACRYCGKEVLIKGSCVRHEKDCKKNPDNK